MAESMTCNFPNKIAFAEVSFDFSIVIANMIQCKGIFMNIVYVPQCFFEVITAIEYLHERERERGRGYETNFCFLPWHIRLYILVLKNSNLLVLDDNFIPLWLISGRHCVSHILPIIIIIFFPELQCGIRDRNMLKKSKFPDFCMLNHNTMRTRTI